MKSQVDNFEVLMGASGLTQVADFIGIYISDTFYHIVNLEQMGICRDNRILVIPDSQAPKTSKIHKKY